MLIWWQQPLATKTCQGLVNSKESFNHDQETFQYSNYRLAGPEFYGWNIPGDSRVHPFWKWFLCRFMSKLNISNIPAEWKSVTKSDAIESLNFPAWNLPHSLSTTNQSKKRRNEWQNLFTSEQSLPKKQKF